MVLDKRLMMLKTRSLTTRVCNIFVSCAISTNSTSKTNVFPANGWFGSRATVSSSISLIVISIGLPSFCRIRSRVPIAGAISSGRSVFFVSTTNSLRLGPYAPSGGTVMVFCVPDFHTDDALFKPGIILPLPIVNSSGWRSFEV